MEFMIQPLEIGGELSALVNTGCNKECPNQNCVKGCACVPPGDDS